MTIKALAASPYYSPVLFPTGYAKAIEEQDGSGDVTRSYVFGHDVIAQSDATSGTLYLMKDGRGTTRALINSSGNVVERYDVDAFYNKVKYVDASGNDLTDDPLATWIAPDGYTDYATGLNRNGQRDVAVWLGQFLSDDPGWQYVHDPANPVTLHLRLYANGNPLYYIDPTGNENFVSMLVTAGINSLLFGLRAIRYGAAWMMAHKIYAAGILIGSAYIADHLQTYFRRLTPPSPRTTAIPFFPPSWATPTGATPGVSAGTPSDANCQLYALNGPRGTPDHLPSEAAAALASGNLTKVRDEMDNWFFTGKPGFRGYPVDPAMGTSSIPQGWHIVALYANVPLTTRQTIQYGFENDFHWRTMNSDDTWESSFLIDHGTGQGLLSTAGFINSGHQWYGDLTYIGSWAIATPPRK